jgi:hypothetical protein
MDTFADLFKKKNIAQIFLLIIFIIYLIMGYTTPSNISNFIQTPFGKILVIILSIALFFKTNHLVGILGFFVAYELIRRSYISTGNYAIDHYLSSENSKYKDLTALNQFPYTLEQEVVKKMAPINQNYDMTHQSSWTSVLDNLHDAAPIGYKGVI